MHRCAVLAGLLIGGVAHAEDPRDVFGFKQKPAEHSDCTDWRTFGCPTATDPFDETSPHGLRTWLPTTYLLRLPVADFRHDDVAHFATGASRDDAGPAFGGATGLENTWTVEGFPIENARNGNVETRIPLVFTQGILVMAGGFSARDRAGLGGSIDVELKRGGKKHEIDAYVWSGVSADARERPVPAATYQLRRQTIERQADTSFAVVASGPLKPVSKGRTWYAVGVAGTVSTFDVDARAARLVDRDNDGLPDGLSPGIDAGSDGKVDLETLTQTNETVHTYSLPMMARLGWERGPHDVTLTLLGTANGDSAFVQNASQQASGVDRTTTIIDGIAAWKGTWGETRGHVMMGWHRSARTEKPRAKGTIGLPQLQTAYVPTTIQDDPLVASGCNDDLATDQFPNIPNCPIPFGFYQSGGAGDLVNTIVDRPVVTANVARRYGNHIVRVGGTFEDTRLITNTTLTGGVVERSLLPGHSDRLQFTGPNCGEEFGSPCDIVDRSQLNYRTRYTAAYIEDTFMPVPRIRVNTGLRWELMWVGPRLHFSDELSPRLGIAWDVRGDGSARWWASMGRTHALLPAGMGSSVIARDRTVRNIELVLPGSPVTQDRRVDNGSVFSIAQDLDPVAQDEVTTGFEFGVVKSLRAGAWIQHRSLRRGLETTMVNANGDVEISNPGDSGPFQGVTALRESTIVAFDVLIAPAPKLSFRATYMWGRVVGTWAGPLDPRQGAILYAGNEWDLDATNLYGPLPSDPGHRVAFEGERRGRIGSVELAVATRLTVANGRPRSILGDGDLGIVYVLPRGEGGRNPTLSQANVRVAARYRRVDFTLDVFNVFDRQEAVATGEVYAGDQVHPIVNGTQQDLVFLKNETCGESGCISSPAVRRSGFALPTAFQSPLAVMVGAHRAF